MAVQNLQSARAAPSHAGFECDADAVANSAGALRIETQIARVTEALIAKRSRRQLNGRAGYWTTIRLGELARLFVQGLSASQIARYLPGNVTRNAVLGVLHRAGLTGGAAARRRSRPRSLAKAQRRATGSAKVRGASRSFARWPGSIHARAAALISVERGQIATQVQEPHKVLAAPGLVATSTGGHSLGTHEAVKAVLGLKETDCRRPYGDVGSDFRFCGKPRMKGIYYCPECALDMFQPPQGGKVSQHGSHEIDGTARPVSPGQADTPTRVSVTDSQHKSSHAAEVSQGRSSLFEVA